MFKTEQFILHKNKIPVSSIHDKNSWMSFEAAKSKVDFGYGVGFVLTAEDNFFFIDIDNAKLPDGKWSPLALDILKKFSGAYVETSMSGNGLHIIGSYVGEEPKHACKNIELDIELYTSGRFVAITTNSSPNGSDKDCTAALQELIQAYFKPTETLANAAPIASVLNDEQVIAKALAAANPFGGFGFKQLWERDVEALAIKYPATNDREYDYSSADAALAQHLAFWTGGDKEQIIRIMKLSALVREKWEREDYLERTVRKAVSQQKTFYNPSALKPPVPQVPSPENPAPQGLQLRSGFQFLTPEQQLEHFKGCVYVQDIHRALTASGELLKPDQFKATYGGYVFALDAMNAKTTTNAWQAFTESQAIQCPRATTQCFRPQIKFGEITEENGRKLVNTYYPITTAREQGNVTPFLTHMQKILPHGDDALIFTSYLAACVQYKGVKFQWAPVLQGVEGNGKTLFTRCLAEAIGRKYVHFPKASDLDNKFNFWLLNKLFIGVEDIYVAEDKNSIIETLKPMITGGDGIEIQAKGTDQITADICANFILNSNHKDALRKTQNDRRFCIFYCAQQEAQDLKRDGMDGNYFPDLYHWLRSGGYAIVHEYLATFKIPEKYNPARGCHRAPDTSTTQQVLASNLGYVEQEIIDAIDEGRNGFKGGWVSSIKLAELIKSLRRSVPANKRRDIMRALGYDWHPALKSGRATSVVAAEGAKPVLFAKKESEAWGIKTAAEATKAYIDAQIV